MNKKLFHLYLVVETDFDSFQQLSCVAAFHFLISLRLNGLRKRDFQ
jgi:hypothetical protein